MTGGLWGNDNYEIDKEGINGKQSLKVKGGVSSIPIVSEPAKTYTFSPYAKADEGNLNGRLFLINPEWDYTVSAPVTLREEWARCVLSMKAERQYYWLAFRVESSAWVDT